MTGTIDHLERLVEGHLFVEALYFGALRATHESTAGLHLCLGLACCGAIKSNASGQRALQGYGSDDAPLFPRGVLVVGRTTTLVYEGFEHLLEVLRQEPTITFGPKLVPVVSEVLDDLCGYLIQEFHGIRGPVIPLDIAAITAGVLLVKLGNGEVTLPPKLAIDPTSAECLIEERLAIPGAGAAFHEARTIDHLERLVEGHLFVEALYFGALRATDESTARLHLYLGLACCGAIRSIAATQRALLGHGSDDAPSFPRGGLVVERSTTLVYEGFEHLLEALRQEPTITFAPKLVPVVSKVLDDLCGYLTQEFHGFRGAAPIHLGTAARTAAVLLVKLGNGEVTLPARLALDQTSAECLIEERLAIPGAGAAFHEAQIARTSRDKLNSPDR